MPPFRSLDRRIVVAIVLISTSVTTLLTFLNFYLDYKSELRVLDTSLEQIKEGALSPLAASLWNFNENQTKVQLEGLIRINDIIRLTVFDESNRTFSKVVRPGSFETRFELIYLMPLVYKGSDGTGKTIGKLEVVATQENITWRLIRKGCIFFATQGLKTLLISFLFLLLIRYLVTNNARALHRFVRTFTLDQDKAPQLILHQRWRSHDEFDELCESINEMAERNYQAFAQEKVRVKLEMDLAATKAIQEALFDRPFNIPGLEIAKLYQSADQTGGDWFSIYSDTSNQRAYILCGDVTGHGLPAALLTGVVSGAIDTFMQFLAFPESSLGKRTPEDILNHLLSAVERVIRGDGKSHGKGMTLSAVCLDLQSGDVWHACAGHPWPFVIRQGSTDRLRNVGPILGRAVKKDLKTWETRYSSLDPGDTLLLFTDGLIENQGPGGRRLANRTLQAVLIETYMLPCQQVLSAVAASAMNCWQTIPLEDDFTILAVRWLGPVQVQRVS